MSKAIFTIAACALIPSSASTAMAPGFEPPPPASKFANFVSLPDAEDIPGLNSAASMTNGVNIFSGDALSGECDSGSGCLQILKFRHGDTSNHISIGGTTYAVPENIALHADLSCKMTSLTTVTETQAAQLTSQISLSSQSDGVDSGDISVGVTVPGCGLARRRLRGRRLTEGGNASKPGVPECTLSATVRAEIMSGSSDQTQNYQRSFSQGYTKSAELAYRSKTYTATLATPQLNASDFQPKFVEAVTALASKAGSGSDEEIWAFFGNYGTHIIKAAQLGFEFRKSVSFKTSVSTQDALKYTKTVTENNMDFFFVKSSDSETQENLEQQTGVDKSSVSFSTVTQKGLVAVGDPKTFCAETGDLTKNTPAVIGITSLYPLSKLVDRLVPGDSGSALAKRMESLMEDTLKGGSCAAEEQYGFCTKMDGFCSWKPGVNGGAGGFDCTKCIPIEPECTLKQITNALSGDCLDANGGGGRATGGAQSCVPGAVSQQWGYDPSAKQLKNIKTGECLDANGGVHMWNCVPGAASQQWDYDPSAKQLKNILTGECLDANGGVHMWNCVPGAVSQQWDAET